jgi:type IV pilus assembly protein PilM
MATLNGAWGIDIGQCALKAMLCVPDGDSVKVEAFDYIEYPKILSQPDGADPQELIRDAIEQFLSRNEVKGYKVSMSVPGQAGLARFFKPPPVDAKKIPDIVKYEAKQQIPFELDDVIWDYQQMGGAEIDGIALDTEVGLFAMKKEAVHRAIAPLETAGVELDCVQLAPLAIFNFVSYDRMDTASIEFDPDNQPPSMVVLSMGTETTDLVVTNGFRVWQRSIPIGGNHFTKQLTKDLKLTFAKAEHLKRNARQAEDSKAIFQAMRPVFNDLVTEVQRSVNFFQSVDRKAKVQGVLILGNAVKLPGLQQYLSKNLGYDVVDFKRFEKLDTSTISSTPAFKENINGFAVSYGLCLQALDKGTLRTNLIPREILFERMIRAKKPWAIGTLAALLLAFTFNFFFYYNAWSKVHEDRWSGPKGQITSVKATSDEHVKKDGDRKSKKALFEKIGSEVVGNADRRILWLELITALNQGLPQTPGIARGTIPDPEEIPFTSRQELFIDRVEDQYFENLTTWYTGDVKLARAATIRILGGDLEEPDENAPPTTPEAGPTGTGWVIEFRGHHFFNDDPDTAGKVHLYNTLIDFLENGSVELANPKDGGTMVKYSLKELGLSYAIIANDSKNIDMDYRIKNPNAAASDAGSAGFGNFGTGDDDDGGAEAGGITGGASQSESNDKDEPDIVASYRAPKYDFSVQVVWIENPLTDRLKARAERLAKEAKELEQEAAREAAENGNGTGTGTNPTGPNPTGPNPTGTNAATGTDGAAGLGADVGTGANPGTGVDPGTGVEAAVTGPAVAGPTP